MHIFEVEIFWSESKRLKTENCVALFVYAFSIAFFKDCVSLTISFKIFVFNRVSNKSAEKQLINNNCII